MVILGKSQGERLGLPHLHATNCVLKLLEHLAFAHQKLEIVRLASGKGLTVDFALKVHCHAITVHSGLSGCALGKGTTLFTQDVQGLVDGGIVHVGRQLIHFGCRQITNFDFGENFKNSVKVGKAFCSTFFFRNTRLASNAQIGLLHRLGEGFGNLIVHDLVLHRVTITLGHDAHRHLARTKSIHLYGTRNLFQARFNFGLDSGQGQAERDFALQLFEGFNGYSHDES